MRNQTEDGDRSTLGRLALLALTFGVGYVLGSRSAGGEPEEWQEVQSEPTEITIDGDGEGEGETGREQEGEENADEGT